MINQTVGMQSESNLQYIKQIILFCNVNMDRVTYTTVNSLLFWKEREENTVMLPVSGGFRSLFCE